MLMLELHAAAAAMTDWQQLHVASSASAESIAQAVALPHTFFQGS